MIFNFLVFFISSSLVIHDILGTMLNKRFMDELFKPQDAYSKKAMRTVFDRLAHASIMRLNSASMDKVSNIQKISLLKWHLWNLLSIPSLDLGPNIFSWYFTVTLKILGRPLKGKFSKLWEFCQYCRLFFILVIRLDDNGTKISSECHENLHLFCRINFAQKILFSLKRWNQFQMFYVCLLLE